MTVHAPPGDDTRSRVLDVAMGLIAEQGFAATSTREVCEQMGFTKAALYYHFRTKDDLLLALVAPVVEELKDLVDNTEISPAPQSRRAVLTRYAELVARHADTIRVLVEDPSVRHRPALQPIAELGARLELLLAGQEHPDLVARTRASAAHGGVRTAIMHAQAHDDPAAVRTAAIAAGCGALGIAAPRTR